MKMLLLLVCLLYLPFANSKDYGVLGRTYVIAEMDFLEFIQQKINSLQSSGQWHQMQSDFKKRVKAHLIRPTPIYLPRAQENRTWHFNPSFTTPTDVRDYSGQLLIKKGAVVNPLDRVSLSSTLLFFNSDDEAQVAWIREEMKRHPKVKLILTSGSLKKSTDTFKQAVYFDLNGFLVNKFHITALPVKVLQKGTNLEINEVSL